MINFRVFTTTVGVGLISATFLNAGESLLTESFDHLEVRALAGQGEWKDNSGMGEAMVTEGNSASVPNHLALWGGGAVHRALGRWEGASKELVIEFSARLGAGESGKNLQVAVRGRSGENILFLNLRGNGRSLDIGPNADTLEERVFATSVPKESWLKVRAVWSLEEERLELIVALPDGGEEFLNESISLPFSEPARLIIGSTQRTESGDWAVDNVSLEVRP